MGPVSAKPVRPADPQSLFQDAKTHVAYRQLVDGVLRGMGVAEADREDLVQDVIERALCSGERFDPERGTWGQWLSGIARNVAHRHAARPERRHMATEDSLEREPLSEDLTPEQAIYARRLLGCLVGLLPTHLREVFLLSAEGHTEDEIASRTGLSVDAVKYRLRRAETALPAVLAKLREDPKSAPNVRVVLFP